MKIARLGMVMAVLVLSGLMSTSARGQVVVEKTEGLSRADLFELGLYTPPKATASRCQPRLDEMKVQRLAKEIQNAFLGEFNGKESERIAKKWLWDGYGRNGRVKAFNPEAWEDGWKNGITLASTAGSSETISGGILSGEADWECTSAQCVEPRTIGMVPPPCPLCGRPPPWCCAQGGCKTQYWVWWDYKITWGRALCSCIDSDGKEQLCVCNYGDEFEIWTPKQGQAPVCAEQAGYSLITLSEVKQLAYYVGCGSEECVTLECCYNHPCRSCSPTLPPSYECCFRNPQTFKYTREFQILCVPYSYSECP